MLRRFLVGACAFVQACCSGQAINGQVCSAAGNALDSVLVENVMTRQQTYSDRTGSFRLTAVPGHLFQCSKTGWKSQRIRIPTGVDVPLYRITLEPGTPPPPHWEFRICDPNAWGPHREF